MRCVLLLGLVVLASGPASGQGDKKKPTREPAIAGRTVAAWAKILDEGKDAAKLAAVNALMRAGPEARPAVPALIKLLAADGSPLRFLAPIALSRVGPDAVPLLEKALASDKASVRSGAALALGLIGPEARAAAPKLIGLLSGGDADTRRAAATALGQIGAREAAGGLKKALGDKDRAVAVEAAWALWQAAEDTSGVEMLSAACTDADNAYRAVQALAEIGPKAKAAEKGLLAAMKSKAEDVRIAAGVAAYTVLGKEEEAVAALGKEMKSADARQRAIAALGQMARSKEAASLAGKQLAGPSAAVRREAAAALVALPADQKLLVHGLDDPDPGVRWWCAVALLGQKGRLAKEEESLLAAVRLGPTPEKRAEAILDVAGRERVGRALAAVLAGRQSRFQVEACRMAGLAGADARPARDELLALFGKGDLPARRAAADAMAGLGTDSIPRLRKLLGDGSPEVRAAAARALGRFGMPALSAVPAILGLLKDPEPAVRVQAALAAWRIDDRAEEAFPVLKVVIADVDNKDRWEALDAFGTIGVEASPPIRGLLEVVVNGVKDREPAVRAVSAKWLWRRTRMGSQVLPLLRDVASDRDPFTRHVVAETLGEIEEEPGVVPLLASALEDREPAIRVIAREGLGRLASPAEMVKLLGSKGARARDGAARALGLMGPRAKEALPALAKLGGPEAESALRRIFPGKGKEVAAYLAAVKAGEDVSALEKALMGGK